MLCIFISTDVAGAAARLTRRACAVGAWRALRPGGRGRGWGRKSLLGARARARCVRWGGGEQGCALGGDVYGLNGV